MIRLPWQSLRAIRRNGFAVRLVHHMQLKMHAVRRFAEVGVVELGFATSGKGNADVVVALVEDIEPRFAGECEGAPLRAAKPSQVERPAHLRLVMRRLFQHERRRIALALPFPGGGVFELPLITLLERLLRQQRTGCDEAKNEDDGVFTHRVVRSWRRFDRGTRPDRRSTICWRRFRPRGGR